MESPRILRGSPNSGDSRYPVCDQLEAQLKASGKEWIIELARWYEADWALAVGGGPEPSADSVLQLIDPLRQEEIRTVLKSIDTRYAKERRQRLSEVDVTIDSGAVAPSDPAGLEPTAEVKSSEVREQSGQILDPTVDRVPSSLIEPTHELRRGDRPEGKPRVKLGTPSPPRSGEGSIASSAETPKEIPGYRIDRVLGRGGMGVVYLAHQEGIDRPVALKMILSGGHADQLMLDRFQAEARAIGRFQHENIVRIYDSGTHEGMPYFSLEFIDGETLSERLSGKPIEPIEAAKLIEPLARAMNYAHDAGVIHRDLKPANILMTKEGVPKITDFGLAKRFEADEQLSMAGSILGTPAFMAPEQARGQSDLGPLADVYGLGAVLYCMITGRPPFQGAKATDTLLQVIRNEPIEPAKLQPGIPKDLETICLKCLQKDKAQRYQSGIALAEDLGRFIRGEPIKARPISRHERVWRWCRRNPKMATASGLAAALALIVMIGGPASAAVIWGQKQEVIAAKDSAEENARIAIAKEQEAVEARVQADKNAEAAAVQEKNAIDALKSMTFVVQRKMAGQSDLIDLREELLQTVRNGLMRMEKNANNARAQDMIAAGIHVRLGDLNMEIGRVAQAKSEYQKCLAIFETLGKENAVPFPSANWSKIHFLLGDAEKAAGNFDEANEHFLESLRIRQQWVKEQPGKDSRTALALSLAKLGTLAKDRGDLDSARAYTEEALALRQALSKANPKDASVYVEVLGTQMVLAKVKFQQRGQVEAGKALMVEAVNGMRQYAGWNPDSDPAKQTLASFDTELGVMQLYTGEIEQADSNLSRAVATLEALKEKHPNNLSIHKELEDALYALAVARGIAKASDAEELIQRAVKLRRQSAEIDDSNVASKLRLLPALARAGELEEGVRLATELSDQIDRGDTTRYDLACGYALLSQARGELEKNNEALPTCDELDAMAIAALGDALAAGFYRYTDLGLDPDLLPVRDDGQYQDLVSKYVKD